MASKQGEGVAVAPTPQEAAPREAPPQGSLAEARERLRPLLVGLEEILAGLTEESEVASHVRGRLKSIAGYFVGTING
jgi:hypothetical protein